MSDNLTGSGSVVLSNHPGPLPIKVSYTPKSNEAVTIIVAGSVSTGLDRVVPIGFNLLINGEIVTQSTICSSTSNSYHFATVPAMLNISLPFVVKDDKVEPITLELAIIEKSETLTDKNDVFNLCIID